MPTPSDTSSSNQVDPPPAANDDTRPIVAVPTASGHEDPYKRTRKRRKLRIPAERRWDRHRPGHWRSERDPAR